MAVAAQLAQLRRDTSTAIRSTSNESTDAAEAALVEIDSRCAVGWAMGRLATLSVEESARLASAAAFALPDPPAAVILAFIARHAPGAQSAVLLAAVAWHETPLFARLVKLFGKALAGTSWAFLSDIAPSGAPRAAFVQKACRDGGQLAGIILDHSRASLAQQKLVPAFVRFYAAFVAELLGVLSAAQLHETYTTLLLPYALGAVRATAHLDLQLAGAMHAALLHTRAPLPPTTVSLFVSELLRTASAAPQVRDAALKTLVLMDAALPGEAIAFFAQWPRAPLALELPAAGPLVLRLTHLALNAALATPVMHPHALPLLRALLARPALRTRALLSSLLTRLHALHTAASSAPALAALIAVAQDVLSVLPSNSLTAAVQALVRDLSPSAAARPALVAFLSAISPASASASKSLPLFLSLHHADASVRATAWVQLDAALKSAPGDAELRNEAREWLNGALQDHDERVLIAALNATHASPLASNDALVRLLTAPRTATLLLTSAPFAVALVDAFLPSRPTLPLASLLPPLLPLLLSTRPHASLARKLLTPLVPALGDSRKRRPCDEASASAGVENQAHAMRALAASLQVADIAALQERASPAALMLLTYVTPLPVAAIEAQAHALLPNARPAKAAALTATIGASECDALTTVLAGDAHQADSTARKRARSAAAGAALLYACNKAAAHTPLFHAPLLAVALSVRGTPLCAALLRALVSHTSLAQLAALATSPDPRPVLTLLRARVQASHTPALTSATEPLIPVLLEALTSTRKTQRIAGLALATQMVQHCKGAAHTLAKYAETDAAELRAEQASSALERRAAHWLMAIDEPSLKRLLPALLTHSSQHTRLTRIAAALATVKHSTLPLLLTKAVSNEPHTSTSLAPLLPHLSALWSDATTASQLVTALSYCSAAELTQALTPQVLAATAPPVCGLLFDVLAQVFASAPSVDRAALRDLLSAVPLSLSAWIERLRHAGEHSSQTQSLWLLELLPETLAARGTSHGAVAAQLASAVLKLVPRLVPPVSPFVPQAALETLTRLLHSQTDGASVYAALERGGVTDALLALTDAWQMEPALQVHVAQLATHLAEQGSKAKCAPAALVLGLTTRLDSSQALKQLVSGTVAHLPRPAVTAVLRTLLTRVPDQRASLLASAQHALALTYPALPLVALLSEPATLATEADEQRVAHTGASLIARLTPEAALAASQSALHDTKSTARVRLLHVLRLSHTVLQRAPAETLTELLHELITSADAPKGAAGKAENTALNEAIHALQDAHAGAPILAALARALSPSSNATVTPAVRRRALRALNERCAALASSRDAQSQTGTALALLPALAAVLNDKHASPGALLTALQSVEVLVRLLGPSSPQSFEALLGALVAQLKTNALAPATAAAAAAAALTLGSYAAALGVRLLAQLPALFPALLAALGAIGTHSPGDVAHLALLSATQVLITQLAAFVGPYLPPLLALLSSSELALADSSVLTERVSELEQQLIKCVAPRILFPALFASYGSASELPSRQHLLVLVQRTMESVAKEELVAQHKVALKFFLRVLAPDVVDAAAGALVALVMRLNEQQFKPLFLQLLEWAALLSPERPPLDERVIVLYRLAALLSAQLRSLFVPYLGYLLEDALARLAHGADRATRLPPHMWHDILTLLREALVHDAGGFFDKPRFDLLVAALVPQLELALHANYAVELHLVPVLTQLGVAMRNDALWKTLHSQLLLKTRSKHIAVRLAAIAAVEALFVRLGEEYLILLPETIPYLSELLEDANAQVEARCQSLVSTIDGLMGGNGSVRDFFQR